MKRKRKRKIRRWSNGRWSGGATMERVLLFGFLSYSQSLYIVDFLTARNVAFFEHFGSNIDRVSLSTRLELKIFDRRAKSVDAKIQSIVWLVLWNRNIGWMIHYVSGGLDRRFAAVSSTHGNLYIFLRRIFPYLSIFSHTHTHTSTATLPHLT